MIGLLASTMAFASEDQFIKCSVDMKDGTHLASETSTLARGVDLSAEKGRDFFAYIEGRTDKRVFRIEAYDTASGDLVATKAISYYKSRSANLDLEVDDLVLTCEMRR
jgi:hypothetical protein